MDKELVEAFVLECKQRQEIKELWKANHVDFNNYFKYSGRVEFPKPVVKKVKVIKNVPIHSVNLNNVKSVIKYYYNNSDLSIKVLAKRLKTNDQRIRKILSHHFKNTNNVKEKSNRNL